MNPWISVKEGLPDHKETVIVWAHSSAALKWFFYGRWHDQSGEEYKYWQDITHWMRLPGDPEGKS